MMSVRHARSRFGTLFGGVLVAAGLFAASPLTSGCGSKEEPKKSRSSDDDDDTPSTRSSSDSPSSYGTSMGSSAKRSTRPIRPDPLDDELKRERPRKSLLLSLTDFVGDLIPNKIIPSSSSSEIIDAADEICRCSDKACVDAISKRMERMGDKRKMEEFSSEEQEAIKKMVACMMKLEETSPRAKPARPAPTTGPDGPDHGGW